VAAREGKEDIVFLRKIVPGRADRSYGIQVARLAGLPMPVVERAKAILQGLERDELSRGGRPTISGTRGEPDTLQLGLFAAGGPSDAESVAGQELLRRLRDVQIDETTPRRALEILAELKDVTETEGRRG
jgi:DNA mismatch repair protein MutS